MKCRNLSCLAPKKAPTRCIKFLLFSSEHGHWDLGSQLLEIPSLNYSSSHSLQILPSEVLQCDMPCQKEVICSKGISICIFIWKHRNNTCRILTSIKASMTSSKQWLQNTTLLKLPVVNIRCSKFSSGCGATEQRQMEWYEYALKKWWDFRGL